jgi:ABC-type multidrug transport system fused ATPase/permease subunit
MSALIGEMSKLSGSLHMNQKRLAYAPQQPWIQNATVRDNILFGRVYDEAKYQAVVSLCCLEPDLEQFPAGDLTEIGEKVLQKHSWSS